MAREGEGGKRISWEISVAVFAWDLCLERLMMFTWKITEVCWVFADGGEEEDTERSTVDTISFS